MKRFLFILGVVLIGSLLAGAGFYLGWERKCMAEALAITTLDKQLAETASIAAVVDSLNSGQITNASHSLHTILDGHIAAVDAQLNYADSRTRDFAYKLFTRIAHNRAEHPRVYAPDFTTPDAWVEERIAAILRRASTNQTAKP